MATGSGRVGHGNSKKPGKEVDKAIRKSILPLFKGQGLEASGSMKREINIKMIKKMLKLQEENNKNIKTIKEIEEEKTKQLTEMKKYMEVCWNKILEILENK